MLAIFLSVDDVIDNVSGGREKREDQNGFEQVREHTGPEDFSAEEYRRKEREIFDPLFRAGRGEERF